MTVNRKTLGKKLYYFACMAVLAVGMLACNLTLAYFSSSDEVTNRHTATDIEIELIEPQWRDHGKADAEKLEPGMVIDKDPKVMNLSENGVYLRMRVIIRDKDGNAVSPTVTADDDTVSLNPFYEKIYGSICCNNSTDTDNNRFVTITTEGITSLNPNFEFIADSDDDPFDGWFYLKTDDGYTKLDAGKNSPELFDYLVIPVLKSEYDSYFGQGFTIEVEAQAIASSVESDKILSEFNSKYTTEKGSA